MTFLLSKYEFISEFVGIVSLRSQQFLNFLNKLVTGFIVFIMLFISLFTIISMVSHMQKIEGDVGLRHKNISIAQVKFFDKIQNAILNPVKANAFSLNPLDAVGGLIAEAMKSVADPVFRIVLGVINSIILPIIDAVIKPLVGLLNGILNLVGGVVDMVENLASNISGTRVGIGFKVYKDIEGANGAGSSSFESSTNFVKRLLEISGYTTRNQTIFNSSFPKKDEAQNLLIDTIAWSDFMNVQKAMQSNLIGDFVAATLKATNVVNFDEINDNITNIVIGKKCENSDIIFSQTPVFRSFGGVQNTCLAENRGIITQQLVARQQQILATTVAKSLQYETRLPPDCRYGQYFEIEPGNDLQYNSDQQEDQGKLGSRIASFASNITLKTITSAECQALKTGKQEQTKSITEIFSASNITAAFGAGAAISTGLQVIVDQLGKAIFASVTAKFNKAITIIQSVGSQINSGIGMYGALIKVIGFKAAINAKLDSLNQEYEQFRNGQYQALNNSETTLEQINQNA
jgi:hypothetical protein